MPASVQQYDLHLDEAIQAVRQELHGLLSAPARVSSRPFLRITFPIRPLNIPAWLNAQIAGSRLFWGSRDRSITIGGTGKSFCLNAGLPENTGSHPPVSNDQAETRQGEPADLRFFAGFCFDPAQGRQWERFGHGKVVLPQFEILELQGAFQFSVNIPAGGHNADFKDKIDQTLQALDAVRGPVPFSAEKSLPPVLKREIRPSKATWTRHIETLLQRFDEQALQKVVLARQTALTFAEPLNPLSLLDRLISGTPNSYHFLFQPGPGRCFLGASPECLFSRTGRTVRTEALAGTRPRGQNEEEDRALRTALEDSAKDRQEHQLVADMIHHCLKGLCTDCDHEPARVIRITGAHHLRTGFSGSLKKECTDFDLLRRLHPTPAVGGTPPDTAAGVIREMEGFARGWFAGPVGLLGRESSEFCVAIRSGLLHDRTLILFSGAGIVPGSDPQSEWLETEHKLQTWTQLFDHE